MPSTYPRKKSPNHTCAKQVFFPAIALNSFLGVQGSLLLAYYVFLLPASAQIFTTNNGISVNGVNPATAGNAGAIAIGSAASSAGINAISIGTAAIASGDRSLAIGPRAGNPVTASGAVSVAIGPAAQATADSAIAIGQLSSAQGLKSTALGAAAVATGEQATAIGTSAQAKNTRASAFGFAANADGINSTAIGADSRATNTRASAFGFAANANGIDSTAIGAAAVATGEQATAIGISAQATNTRASAFGFAANANGIDSTAIGANSEASGTNSTSLGKQSRAIAPNSTAIGFNSVATQPNQIVIGTNISKLTIPSLGQSGSFLGSANQNGSTRLLSTDGEGNLGTTNISSSQVERIPAIESAMSKIGTAMNAGTSIALALSAVPTVSEDPREPIRCGIGTGGYGGTYAFGLGCAARVFNRLQINGGLSFAPPVDYGYGTTPKVGGRIGFSFPLGVVTPSSRSSAASSVSTIGGTSDANTKAVIEQLRNDLDQQKQITAKLQQQLQALMANKKS
jgi:autotransporter adhesin